MANPDTPNGFAATGHMKDLQPFDRDSAEATAIFRGDMINAMADGNVQAAAAGATSLLGAVAGGTTVDYGAKSLLAASVAGVILVHWDPDQMYICQAQTADTSAQTALFANVDHVAGAGSTVTGLSGHELNLGTQTTTNGGGFKLIDHLMREDNDLTAENAKYKCVLNTGEALLRLITGLDT